MGIVQTLNEKLQQRDLLLREIDELLEESIGLEVRYKGEEAIIHDIYNDNTADIAVMVDDPDEGLFEKIINVPLIEIE